MHFRCIVSVYYFRKIFARERKYGGKCLRSSFNVAQRNTTVCDPQSLMCSARGGRMNPVMKSRFSTFMLFVLGCLTTVASATYAAGSPYQREIDEYVEIFSGGSFHAHKKAMDKMVWAGISSPRVFDPIANQLESLKNSTEGEKIQAASWYAKWLALSGNKKYRPLLESIAGGEGAHKKLRKHANTALERLDKYAGWNPVISKGLSAYRGNDLEAQRVKNMLGASDYELLKIGAKRVYHGHSTDDKLISMAASRLGSEWKNIDASNKAQIDTLTWLIKVVGVTGGSKYKSLLQDIEANASHKKVRKYATKYLKSL